MKHMMLDCYGCTSNDANDCLFIYNLLNELADNLSLKPIAPPQLIPYYYGKVKEDNGISSFLLIEGGHITIHSFPFRGCYFVDIFSPTNFNDSKVKTFFQNKLPFNESKSIINVKDRTIDSRKKLKYDPEKDFGPHILMKIEADKPVNSEVIALFLEGLVANINMTPITRACVINSSLNKPKYLSGIILIAESHISYHYNYKTKEIYFDIFSCCSFDFSTLEDRLSVFGKVTSNELIARGSKHINKISAGKDFVSVNKKQSFAWVKNSK